VSYNASAVKVYNATGSLVRFENKKVFSSTLKNALALLQRWRCSCEFKSRRIGLRHDMLISVIKNLLRGFGFKYIFLKIVSMVRVTRLGEFSPIGRLFMYFGLLFENYKSSSNYRAIFSTVKLSIDTDKNGLGCILGDSFSNLSGHGSA
jgi:hypothetical protein